MMNWLSVQNQNQFHEIFREIDFMEKIALFQNLEHTVSSSKFSLLRDESYRFDKSICFVPSHYRILTMLPDHCHSLLHMWFGCWVCEQQ